MRPAELVINVDLRDSLGALRGEPGEAPDHVDVLAAFLYSLSKGYGLSESQHLVESQLELAEPPEAVAALFGHVVGLDPSSLEGEAVRDALYRVFLDLSGDIECRQSLNRNQPLSESGVLTLAQVFWNIEGTPTRPHLPLRPLGEVPLRSADIPVQGSRDDYAVMMWTQRTNLGAQGLGPGAAHRSSGQGFRIKGARLAVLAALRLVRDAPEPLPDLAGATFVRSDNGDLLAIGWPPQPDLNGAVPPSGVETTALGAVADPSRHEGRVVVGWAGEVGPTYQPRSCDDEMTRIWAGDGDRRVWLRGGPGFGKTFIARRVMQEALRRQDAQRERLLVWVDSADADTVATAFSRAAEQLRLAPDLAEGGDEQRARSLARSLIVLLAGCDWPWLVVLDNADPGSLFQAGLVPPGRNPQGRVVITTLGHDSRMVSSGHVLPVEVFTPDESERYVRVQVDPRTGGPAALSRVPKDAARSLARAVAGHPLALSIAVATIVANHMEVEDWIAEFESAAAMDAVGDSPDAGGYPLLVAAAWGLALDKAAAGSSPGVVLRAAAVAAVQDPDGHPTWLWEQEAIRAWVAGQDELVVSHGQPRVVRSLVDHGLCEVRGDSWRVGRLGMHQLAARAVRERLPAEDVSHLAAILLEEWLLGVTGAGVDQSHRANIATLAALPGLTGSATTTARALLAFLPTGDPEGDLVGREEWLRVLREIDPAVLEGSQEMIAEGLVELADALRAVERHDESNRAAEEALAAYEVLLAGPAESPAQTAAWWIALGDLQQRVGRQGRDAYSQAASILDHLVATTDARRELIELLGKLASVRLKLGEPALAAELRGRREDLIWQAALDADPSDVDWGHALAQWAAVLRSRGEFVAASIEYARAAEVFALPVRLSSSTRDRF